MEEFIFQLEELGFYKYENPNAIAILKTLSIQERSIWLFDDFYQCNDLIKEEFEIIDIDGFLQEDSLHLDEPHPRYRLHWLDLEDLHDNGTRDLFQEPQPFLAKNGLIFSEIIDYYNKTYDFLVKIDGIEYFIYPDEINSEKIPCYEQYNFTAQRVFQRINNFLAEVKSPERAYVIRAEKEKFAPFYFGFLTLQLYEKIQQSSFVKD
jgi:hypothetical protein